MLRPGEKGEDDRSSPIKNVLLVLSFLLLIVLLLAFALNDQANQNSAKSWRTLAGEAREINSLLRQQLEQKENDILALERRQSALAGEKASAEDERSAYKKLVNELIRAASLQQRCSNNMALLANKISQDDFVWLRRNGNRVLLFCERASDSFQEIARGGS